MSKKINELYDVYREMVINVKKLLLEELKPLIDKYGDIKLLDSDGDEFSIEMFGIENLLNERYNFTYKQEGFKTDYGGWDSIHTISIEPTYINNKIEILDIRYCSETGLEESTLKDLIENLIRETKDK